MHNSLKFFFLSIISLLLITGHNLQIVLADNSELKKIQLYTKEADGSPGQPEAFFDSYVLIKEKVENKNIRKQEKDWKGKSNVPDYRLISANFLSEKKIWQSENIDSYAVSENILYTIYNNNLKAFNFTKGEKLWETSFPGKTDQTPKIFAGKNLSEKSLFLQTDNALISFDPQTGQQKWINQGENEYFLLANKENKDIFIIISQTKEHAGKYSGFDTQFNYLYAVNTATGKKIWSYKSTNYLRIDYGFRFINDVIYFIDITLKAKNVRGLDLKTGKNKLKLIVKGDVYSNFILPAEFGLSYAISSDEKYHYINAVNNETKNKHPKWKQKILRKNQGMSPEFGLNHFESKSSFILTQSEHQNGEYKSLKTTIIGLDNKNGAKKWEFIVPNQESIPPAWHVVIDEILILKTDSNIIYALDTNNGKIIWQTKANGSLLSHQDELISDLSLFTPAIIKNEKNIIFATDKGFVYALSLKNGSETWKINTTQPIVSESFFKIDQGKLFFLTTDNKKHLVYRVDSGTGKVLNTTELDMYSKYLYVYQGQIFIYDNEGLFKIEILPTY